MPLNEETKPNQKEKPIKPFGFCVKPILKEAEISFINIPDTLPLVS